MPATVPPIPVKSAEGTRLYLENGLSIIDGMSSWWTVAHGHRHPHLVEAACKQINQMPHVMFGGLTHQPAVELAEWLISRSPEGLDLVFYSDSGSVSVEVAMKMALQYQRGNGHPERHRLVTWRRGYHGDTQGPMSVCDPDNGMHSFWQGTLVKQIFAPAPPTDPSCDITAINRSGDKTESSDSSDAHSTLDDIDTYLGEFESYIDDTVAAVLVEPIVQGAGGMRFHHSALLTGLRRLCDKHDILLIVDEIATGFGRTGSLFACDLAAVTPDIMCIGKALTGGMMSFAATLTTRRIGTMISTPQGGGALMHGPTYMGNPLACAVARAAGDLIDNGYWRLAVPRIEQELRIGLAPLVDDPAVASLRAMGAIGVVETVRPIDMCSATQVAVESGVWLRPFGKLVYCMPPFTSSSEDITAICRAIRNIVDEST
ncbi:adenosylmethionine--8-amino-7-oxononanoate transaminase [Corynebacterium kroppenstedtii]|uniref:adenosylmethionine--8-amino-7-oxononanoate transaminase n=1 Tax=Corynebacterium sp. PCR 32 TaxID=3351342 RepID=UPI0037502794